MANDEQPTMTTREVTSLVTLFTGMLNNTKSEIIDKISENSTAARERWTEHEREHAELMRKLDDHIAEANAHWSKEHDEEVAFQARVKPVQSVADVVVHHWRDILILAFAILGILGVADRMVVP